MFYARILQVNGVHQVVQGNVRVAAAQTHHQRRKQSQERVQRITPKCAEQQIEPNYVRLTFIERFQKANRTQRIVERPTAINREALKFSLVGGDTVSKNRQADKRIAAQFLGKVQSILA
jgi:hypothetical protein